MKTLISIFLLFAIGLTGSETATSVLSKMDQTLYSIKDKKADVEMVMINLKSGAKKIKKAKYYQKGLDKILFRYTYPKSDAGIATLTIPGAVYLYLPMFKKPKKITNLAESNAFNKSDFSLEDMNTKSYSELYTPKLLAPNAQAYLLELIPKDKNSSYSKLVVSIHKTRYYPLKIDYYTLKGERLKTATYEYINIGNSWVSNTVVMTNHKKNHRTKFIMTNIKVNSGLKDDLFSVENMVGSAEK